MPAAEPVSAASSLKRDLLIAAAGFVGFGAFVSREVPHLRHEAWAHALLLFAALVILPLALRLGKAADDSPARQRVWRGLWWLRVVASVALTYSFTQPPGTVAFLLAAPWLGFLASLAVVGAMRLAAGSWRDGSGLSRDAGLAFAAVGAAWLAAERLGLQPLGFSPSIVLLTAVHFHFAGLLLPLVTARVLTLVRAPWLAWWIVAGVPLVAVGITVAQLGGGTFVELLAAWALAIAGLAVAAVHLRLARHPSFRRSARIWWGVAGVSLALGMMLAALYGSRGWLPVPTWIDVPWMRAFHGTLNALGFGFGAALAWRLAEVPPKPAAS